MFDDVTPGPTTEELPIPDYRHLPAQAIEGRILELDGDEVETVLRYECEHRERTPLIRVLTARLRGLRERSSVRQPPSVPEPPSVRGPGASRTPRPSG
ncbi:hypothetical protein [Actinacidiphila yeochonensis]|uniref:hypothetical protein n=1 Tax=Actinacidiphila yeochonensis TaxID=89050 RepID=UPI0006898C92|nr:hypothetical protein [Actinacidiphila yeochonensis]